MIQWLTDGDALPGGATYEQTSSLATALTFSVNESILKTEGSPGFGQTSSTVSQLQAEGGTQGTTQKTENQTRHTRIESAFGGSSSSTREVIETYRIGDHHYSTHLTESGETSRVTASTFLTSEEIEFSGYDLETRRTTWITRMTSFSSTRAGGETHTGIFGGLSTSSTWSWTFLSTGMTSTAESSTASASLASTGPALGTSTTFICTHTGSTTQTSTFERTQISHSAGVPVTTTVTVTDLTTLDTSYTVSASGTTTVAGAAGGKWHHTVLQADWGRHLFVAPPLGASAIGPALDFFTWSGSQVTLTPEFESSGSSASGETTAETTSTSSFSSTLASGTQTTATTWGTMSSATNSGLATRSETAGGIMTGGLVVSDPYAPDWSFAFPPEGEAGAATLSLVGPATLSLTLVPGGTHASSTTTFSAADGATATTTFASGIAVFASGCLANADIGNTPTHGHFKVIEVDCFEGWLPQCS